MALEYSNPRCHSTLSSHCSQQPESENTELNYKKVQVTILHFLKDKGVGPMPMEPIFGSNGLHNRLIQFKIRVHEN